LLVIRGRIGQVGHAARLSPLTTFRQFALARKEH
jgi:hypothetical protein